MTFWKLIKDSVSTEFNTQEEMTAYINDNSLSEPFEIYYYMGSQYATDNPGTDGWDKVI